MKKLVLLIFAFICFGSTAAMAGDVLVVQGHAVKPYEEALRGIKSVCGDVKRIHLADVAGKDMTAIVRSENPRVIVAIGPEALKRVQKIKQVPVIYLMVLNPTESSNGNKDITGITMNIAPEKYFDLIARISPRPKSIGVIYDPAKSTHLIRRAQQAAREKGFRLVTREVHQAKEVPAALQDMNGSIDLLWMLPDTTVVTPETAEIFLLASHQRKIPVISFADKYVEMGALAALVIDSFDQGQQAGEMARKLLDGKAVSELPGAEARSSRLKINLQVTRKIGVTVNP